MREFRYERADDVDGAVALLADHPDGAFLGGGTNLVDLMKLGVATPDVLVDVRELTSAEVTELP
ncbi:MAG: FAD binding domain-containing protein, partial [Blastococcus sp.]